MATLPDPQELEELIIKSAGARNEPGSPIISSAASSTGSSEESGPPTPVNGPPQNYDIVVAGIYRSSFPRPSNFEHLSTLGLKTVVTLVEAPHPPEYTAFLEQSRIVHYEIPFPAHKGEVDCIPVESMMRVLDLMCDATNYPMLIHCNKGKHRTGCAIACYRICCGQTITDVIEEYRFYAGAKARLLDERYIRAFVPSAKHRHCGSSASSTAAKRAYPTPPASEKGVNV